MSQLATKQNRLDASDRYFLTQELTSIDPNKYYHLVPGIVGRANMAPIEGVSPELPVYKWTMTKLLSGPTTRRGGKSRSAPMVSVIRTEETQQILTHEESFGWTVDEVRAARKAGLSLPEDRQQTAVTGIEQWIDQVLCTGEPEANVYGLANNPNVGNTNAGAAWAANADNILADLTNFVEATAAALKQAQVPGQKNVMYDQFVLFISAARYRKLMTLRLGATNEITVLKYIRENFEMIKKIVPWWRLDTANSVAVNGTNAMAVLAPCLDNGSINPMAGGALLPNDYEQLPEQYEGRNVIVPASGKCGGFVPRHAVAFRTLKGI